MKYLCLLVLSLLLMGQTDWYHSPVSRQIPFDNATNGFTADEVQAAIEEAKLTAEGLPRLSINLINNGVTGNNDWISYSELTPNTNIIFPLPVRLSEIAWSNSNTSVEFSVEFYKNGRAGGDLLFTYGPVTSGAANFGYVSGLNYEFAAGDWIIPKYIDQGTNCSDLVLSLWLQRIN